jgi:hypothetical protein
MWVELQRLVRDLVRKKVPDGSGAFFVLYGRFLRVFREKWCAERGAFVVKTWWNAW